VPIALWDEEEVAWAEGDIQPGHLRGARVKLQVGRLCIHGAEPIKGVAWRGTWVRHGVEELFVGGRAESEVLEASNLRYKRPRI
jgi:hypothetical protein